MPSAALDCELSANDKNPHGLLSRNGYVSDMSIPTAVIDDVAPEMDDPDFVEIDYEIHSDDGSYFGQNGYVDATSSEDDECVAVSSAAKAAPVASFTGDEGGCVEPWFAPL